MSRNVFFELTRVFNRTGPVAILASGPAVTLAERLLPTVVSVPGDADADAE